jgi:biotin carboxylase
MDRIALVGVPWNTPELTTAAEDALALSMRLCVVDTDDALAKVSSSVPCDRLVVPSMSAEVIAAALKADSPRCVVSTTELRLELAARVRELLRLPGTPSESERAVSDKLRTRRLLAAAGLTNVPVWATSIAKLPALVTSLRLPVVVKPRALAGSNGVRLLEHVSDVRDALGEYDPVEASRYGRDELLVEEFIPGIEVSAEGLVIGGQLLLLSLTDKVNNGAPYFQEIGHVMPSKHSAARRAQVEQYLQRVIDAIGIETSPIHAEIMLQDDGLELVELHTRFGGGNIVRLLSESLGIRPFKAYFSAILEHTAPALRKPDDFWGVAFFSARVGQRFSWPSFNIPHAGAVAEIDLASRREPKLTQVEGVRIRYWRAGHALFTSSEYAEVYDNIKFIASQSP